MELASKLVHAIAVASKRRNEANKRTHIAPPPIEVAVGNVASDLALTHLSRFGPCPNAA
jgi:hypothetical protein